MLQIGQLILEILFVVNILFGFAIVFLERKNPSSTWAWLLVIMLVPFFGFIIYLLLGMDGRKHNVFSKKAKLDEELHNNILSSDIDGLKKGYPAKNIDDLMAILKHPVAEHLSDLVFLNYYSANAHLHLNNSVKLYHEGTEKFDDMIEDIENAKSFVHILYYIMHDDELGHRVMNALAKKAREGVEVKLMIDGMGCYKTRNKFWKILEDAGGEVVKFLPPRFIRINYRNHRKICVIDGEIGYIGGLNIGDEYVGKYKKFGFWRDSHIRVIGDIVKDLEIRFIFDYNFYAEQKIPIADKYFPVIQNNIGQLPMQMVSSGPDTKWYSIHYAFIKMMFEAEKSIYIQTPYFAPDDSIFHALKIAAMSGIDVRIMIPAIPDHPFVYWSSLSFLGQLLQAGVKCYKYEKGFMHSKLLMIDSTVCSVGTANMDMRSFMLNFEINAFIYDRKTTVDFEVEFLKDLDNCTEITQEWYDKRSRITRIKESVSRLISPLL